MYSIGVNLLTWKLPERTEDNCENLSQDGLKKHEQNQILCLSIILIDCLLSHILF
jgi:hypothetical protein